MSLAGLIVLFAVVGFFAWKAVKQRSAAFAAAAEGLGFVYKQSESPFAGTDLSGITLLTETVQHRYRDVLVPKAANRPVVVSQFNYRIFLNTLGKESGAVVSGGSGQGHSLLAYRIAHGSLPRFRLFTRGAFGNLGIPVDAQAFPGSSSKGAMDLGSPAFAQRYILVAEDETAVRMLFDPFLVQALVEQPPHTWLHVQVSPDWLLFYDPAIIILKPEAVAPALERIGPIAGHILAHATVPDSPQPAGATASSDRR